ncbi:hypothetical protein TNIN_259721 [Trichonephila inaurata madagascariensis]|uniref:Secreted protein n=1 Tax=Trichonephila inaurata madagascariensis TaxID=2747483 RepID=A0A8X6WVH5_9ARAC|nr:hypothetical protein TNIN_259721 [Trichonephila inaurata madagascariensis]
MTFAKWSPTAVFICIVAVSHSLEYSKLISETTQTKKPEVTKPGSVETVGAHEEKEAPLHEVMVRHPIKRPPSALWAEEDSKSISPRARILRPRRVHPGQYAGEALWR